MSAHEPNPALIVDWLWNLIEANRAASLLWDGVDPALLEPPINMLRLAVHPGGLPSISSLTAACKTQVEEQHSRPAAPGFCGASTARTSACAASGR
jgi:hypothetical protein